MKSVQIHYKEGDESPAPSLLDFFSISFRLVRQVAKAMPALLVMNLALTSSKPSDLIIMDAVFDAALKVIREPVLLSHTNVVRSVGFALVEITSLKDGCYVHVVRRLLENAAMVIGPMLWSLFLGPLECSVSSCSVVLEAYIRVPSIMRKSEHEVLLKSQFDIICSQLITSVSDAWVTCVRLRNAFGHERVLDLTINDVIEIVRLTLLQHADDVDGSLRASLGFCVRLMRSGGSLISAPEKQPLDVSSYKLLWPCRYSL